MSGTLVEIESFEVVAPLPAPLKIGGMEIHDRQYTLVRMRDDDGVEGVSYGLSRNAPVAETVTRAIAPTWKNRAIDDHEALYDSSISNNVCLGTHGVFWRALSLCDCAFYDLLAKRADVGLGEYLGGKKRTVKMLLVGGYPSPEETLDSLANQVKDLAAFKPDGIKIASCMDFARDTVRLQTCRDALGPELPLMIDLFWQVNDAKAFVRAVRPWQDLNLGWIEDPVAFDDYEALETIKRELDVIVAMGDEQSGQRAFERLLKPGRVDVLRLDATVCGGVRAFTKAAAMADRHGRSVAGHVFDQLHYQLAAATPNLEWIERMPESLGLDSAHLLWSNGGDRDDGQLDPQRPGVGIEWDWNAVERYRSKPK